MEMAGLKKNYYHNKRVLEDLRLGDRVQFKRKLFYSHWGIYIGNGKIIHLAGEENDGINGDVRPKHVFTICGQSFDKAKVCIEDFWEVVGDDTAEINNCDDKWSSLNPEKIVARAKEKLGRVGYNIIFDNCEHFANWCRYGRCKSDQVDNFLTGAAVAGATVLSVGAVYALVKYANRDKNKLKVET
ncbi:Phospholipase A and acyltransferase 3 [Bulinus truncatus]|nr:Phospholipase A and acyltransferase 3 [Bulinus truncatus]